MQEFNKFIMSLSEWGSIVINIMISLSLDKIGNTTIECYLTKSILVKSHLLIFKKIINFYSKIK
jgi:hypothetical protein